MIANIRLTTQPQGFSASRADCFAAKVDASLTDALVLAIAANPNDCALDAAVRAACP
ncbi:MAG: hypothetical protein H7338_01855 [Candidatus Sericytochromatia bacterium]|nr:hypothetical protein [Candidatus Sericytochromatia bacterium]